MIHLYKIFQACSSWCDFLLYPRPIDIQTSDAGPGVSSHEKLVQIRMAEYFQVFNLDLQARIHYAPNDSRSHIAEQVMRSLNEATGDGRSIPVPKVPLFGGLNQDEVLSLTQDEFNALESKRQEEISKLCAKEIERRYRGKRCMGTSIHSRTPSYSQSANFFFDDVYMKKVHDSSQAKQSSCAGSTYYFKQLQFVKDHYIVHDGAIEGIRNGCFDGKKMCDVHQSTLGCNWRGPPVHRVPAPVPCYKGDRSGFHYTNPDLFSDAPEKERKIDEFCPRAELEEAVKKVGPIQVKEREVCGEEGSVKKSLFDNNDTLNKLMANVDEIVERYTGEDLRRAVESEFKRKYSMLLKAHFAKGSRAANKADELSKSVDEIDWKDAIETGKIDKMYVSQLDLYLEKVAGFPNKAFHAKGFTKSSKIYEIKKHFYSNQGTATQQPSLPHPVKTTQSSTPSALKTVSPPPPQPITPPPPPPPGLMIIPWGGLTISNGNALQLINTCPIDNCLMILHALTTESAKIISYLDNNNELVCQILCKSLELVRRGEFAEAKLEWIKMGCPIKVGANGILDFWGNEETMFTQYLIPLMRSNVTSSCSSTSCPQLGVSIRWANTVALRYLSQCFTKPGPI